MLEQRLRTIAVIGIQHDAHRAREGEIAFGNRPWLGDVREHPLEHERDGIGLPLSVDDEHELVAAKSSDRIAFAHLRLESSGDGPQQLIADMMTEAVVDELE